MPDLGSVQVGGPAYIAIKSKSAGWLNTGEKYDESSGSNFFTADTLPVSGSVKNNGKEDQANDPKIGPPAKNSSGKWYFYGNTREVKAKIEREYGGIGSHGGPVVSGRSDHSNFIVEQSANKATAEIFQHCCSGDILEWVHIVAFGQSVDWDVSSSIPQPKQGLHIRLQNANVAKFEFTGGRYFGDHFQSFDNSTLSNSTTLVRGGKLLGVTHVVRYELWYTSISVEYDGIERGWDTGTDTAWRNKD